MDPKLTILFLLIGTIIGLSHLNEETVGRLKQMLGLRRWRQLVPVRRKS